MKAHPSKLLDDRIDFLYINAAEPSPAQRVFGTAYTILTLIRVSAPVSHLSVDSHWRPNQDKCKKTYNKDFMDLSEYCFNICNLLEITFRGKSAGDLNEPIRMAIKDLER